jgi:hypothetical protein
MAAAGLLLVGCGTTTALSPSAASSPSASSGFSAFRTCLQQHGVTLPTARPSSGTGFGGFGGNGSESSTFQQAMQACASLRPSFGSGGFGGFGTALQAFRSCMASHGESIPTTRPTSPPTAGESGPDRFLNGLNPSNSKVAAALKACQSKLPSFAGG